MTELQSATRKLIRLAQLQTYNLELTRLENERALPRKSEILSLKPYIHEGILRVGGRLENSTFCFNKVHPIILPKNHILTKLIAQHLHESLLHCGPQHLLASLRRQYWPIGARNLVRHIIHSCIKCRRADPKAFQYQMGSLPVDRFDANFPFENVGVDYAGPFIICDRRSRPFKEVKCYVALFVCLLTKAIQIELVSDLSTDKFILALHRFVARRGKPRLICSDNGTNFVGASRKISEMSRFINNKANQCKIIDSAHNEGIRWKFIPPRAPHFGGLREAGVKSIKNHLRKVIGSQVLSFEDLATALIQIEAVLNSRPLHPLSSDPTDLSPLTPSHFLIGRSANIIPEKDVRSQPENRLQVYKKIQRIHQMFWHRWSSDYICELQKRTKWKENASTLIQPGMMVILKDDNLPPMMWKLGRVRETYPGADEVVRVAAIQCADSLVKRPVVKLCPLFPEQPKDNKF